MSRRDVEIEAKHARAMADAIDQRWKGADRRTREYKKAMRERGLWLMLAKGAEEHLTRPDPDDEDLRREPGPDDAPLI